LPPGWPREHGDRAWAELLARHHAIVRRELERFRGREVDNAGDGSYATFDGPGKAVRCALALTEAMAALALEIRAGLHTGERELIGPKIGGIAGHIGARIMALAEPGQVLVSRTAKDLVVGSGLRFAALGERPLKGVEGTWELYAAGT
jgi:class 3 adenylate cyclase